MSLIQMKQALSLTKIPDSFSESYESVKDCYMERTEQMLSEELIINTLKECGILGKYLDLILEAACLLRQKKEFRLFLALLYKQWRRSPFSRIPPPSGGRRHVRFSASLPCNAYHERECKIFKKQEGSRGYYP